MVGLRYFLLESKTVARYFGHSLQPLLLVVYIDSAFMLLPSFLILQLQVLISDLN